MAPDFLRYAMQRKVTTLHYGGEKLPRTTLLEIAGPGNLTAVKLLLDNLPPSLHSQRETLARCLEAMNRVLPLQRAILFGSHVRGEARPDSDVDLCLVAEGADRQLEAAQQWRVAMRPVWPRPAFTLIPIAPGRLAEKKTVGDHFFATIFQEGVLLATED